MALTFGIFAHVDAGKTTLSEQLLYRAGVLRGGPGRVDHGNTLLDSDALEKDRGITIYSGQAGFTYSGASFTLIDTPGHVDFAADAERSMMPLDLAILLADGSGDIRAHTAALYRMLDDARIPVIIFVNKCDLVSFDRERTESGIRRRLTDRAVSVNGQTADPEALSMLDDAFCEQYLSGTADSGSALDTLAALTLERRAVPVFSGAALNGTGVDDLLCFLHRVAVRWSFPADLSADVLARVYRIKHDDSGNRVTYLRILQGTLRPRAQFRFGEVAEKVNRILLPKGVSYEPAETAFPGDAVAVTGLTVPRCGDLISPDGITDTFRAKVTPVLLARVTPVNGVTPQVLLEKLRILEDEEPALGIVWDAAHSAVNVRIMGTVQSAVLTEVLKRRFGIEAQLEKPEVLYEETVRSEVTGCGHYEPLRHYAEAHLRLEPGPRGSGITFASECSPDDLTVNYQSLIRTHVFEKTHRGVLTGAPLTDVRVTLLSGRAHLKHTEGGDFREAVYRAVRQALMKAGCTLLEPYYRFEITVPSASFGRVMTDLTGRNAECDSPVMDEDTVTLTGRAPVAALMEYPTLLRSSTHGSGDIRLSPDGYDLCHNADEVIEKAGYDPMADTENPPGSVFCSHGAGYYVAWYKADEFMHLPVEPAGKTRG